MSQIEEALSAIRRGDYDAALALLKECKGDREVESAALGHRAYLLQSLARFAEAKSDWTRFLELNPRDRSATAHLARTQIELGETSEGVALLAELLREGPMDETIRAALARAATHGKAPELTAYNHMTTSREHRPMNAVIAAIESDAASYPASIYPEIGRFIYSFICIVRPKVVVETGTCYGYSALCIAQALKDQGGGHLYCFDLFMDRPEYTSPVIGKCADSWKVANEHLRLAELTDYVTLVRGDSSANITSHFSKSKQTIDVAFVDGDHLIKGARKDFAAVDAFIQPEGFVLFHDIFPNVCLWMGPRNLLNAIDAEQGNLWRALNIPTPEGCGVAVLQKYAAGSTKLAEPALLDLVKQRIFHQVNK